MKILSAAEMRAADEATFSKVGIPSRAVMEAAGRAVATLLLERFPEQAARGTLIVTGPGNNGGDGFVIARTLANLGLSVQLAALTPIGALKGDALSAAAAFRNSEGTIQEISESSISALPGDEVGLVVDALFGTGLKKPLEGVFAAAVEWMNRLEKPVVAVDVPSGVNSDTGEILGVAVRATMTATLHCPKLCHVVEPACYLCGELTVLDIGLGAHLGELAAIKRELITTEHVIRILKKSPLLSPEAHKGRRGHVVVAGGSLGKFGAPHLSAQAALLSGAGLVTLALPGGAASELAPSLMELMVAGLDEKDGGFAGDAPAQLSKLTAGKDALVLGPGMGNAVELPRFVSSALHSRDLPAVVDADALNILSERRELLSLLGSNVVVTPHPGEMARLLGCSVPEVQSRRLESAAEFSRTHGCVTVLKGARTVIASADGSVWVNPAASAVLGTAGSGDSLAGVIGALLAQGVAPIEAACCGVFVHGAAGELLEHADRRLFGVTATTISENIPRVMNLLLARAPELTRTRSSRTVAPGMRALFL